MARAIQRHHAAMSKTVLHPAPARVALVVVVLWLGVFLVAPVLTMVGGFVAPSDVSRVLALPSTWRLVWFSLWQSAISVAVTLVIAAPVTWLIGLHRFRGRRILRHSYRGLFAAIGRSGHGISRGTAALVALHHVCSGDRPRVFQHRGRGSRGWCAPRVT